MKKAKKSTTTWHIVVQTDVGRIVGVFGAALLADCQEFARKLTHEHPDKPAGTFRIEQVGAEVRPRCGDPFFGV